MIQYLRHLGLGWNSFTGGNGNLVYYYKDYTQTSLEWNKAMTVFNKTLSGGDFVVSNIRAIFNETLIRNFITYWKLNITRFHDSPNIFFRDTFDSHHQQWAMGRFKQMVLLCEWNENLTIPLVATAHGTDFSLAEKIAQVGFANLSTLDAGFFGRGIYFSSYVEYTLPYILMKKNPSILVSYVCTGHTYPVIEQHKGPESLLGASIMTGYSSHYVVTDRDGNVTDESTLDLFDEIVVGQEAQICPAFIFSIDNSNFETLKLKWA